MDIRQALLDEHSKRTKDLIVKFVAEDPSRFAALLNCALEGNRRLAECAVWPLGELMVRYPVHLKKNWPRMIRLISGKDHHPAVYRNMLRSLQFVEVPEKYAGQVIDVCFRFLSGGHVPVAVRANAITVAARLCAPYPELARELSLLLEDLGRLQVTGALSARIRDASRLLHR